MLALLVCAGCLQARSEQPEVTVAVVSGEPVYADEFRMVYVDYLLKTGLKDEQANRRRVLDALIDEYLLVQDAQASGIAEEEEYLAARNRHRSKLLIEAYVKAAVLDTLQIAEDELKDMFIRANTTMTARHLFARTREQAEALYARLEKGASFERLAREVFADTVLANHGGYVGEFTLDEMDLAFEEAAFALEVGEISKPVKTSTGYSIIKLEGRFVKPLITEYEFAERRDRMMHFVSYRKKLAARTTLVNNLEMALSVAFQENTVNQLLDQITGVAPASNSETEDAWLNKTLATYRVGESSQTLSVAAFRVLAETTSGQQRAAVVDKESLEQFIKGLLVREEMIRRAETLQLDQSSLFIQTFEKANRTWIRDFVTTRMMDGVEASEDTLQKHYAQFREDFITAPQTRVWEILLDSKAEADRLLEKLKTTSFEALAGAYSLRPGADAASGDLGYLTPEQMGVMREHVLNAKENEIIGPLALKGYYVLLKVGDHLPGKMLSFDEALPQITGAVKSKLGKQQLRDHIQNLRLQNKIAIDHDLLATLPLKSDEQTDESHLLKGYH